jgi:hypothetical protein
MATIAIYAMLSPPNDLSTIHANSLGQRGVGGCGVGDDPGLIVVVRQETGTGMPARACLSRETFRTYLGVV